MRILAALLILTSSGLALAGLAERSAGAAPDVEDTQTCTATCPLPSPQEMANMHFNRGTVYQARNDLAMAVAEYTQARRLLPEHPQIESKLRELGVVQ